MKASMSPVTAFAKMAFKNLTNNKRILTQVAQTNPQSLEHLGGLKRMHPGELKSMRHLFTVA